ncbi:MAG: recombination regulator RecX [Burkholderiaceae bacterium]|nr:recombination regulator RecX [Roseateles sp.]MBV8471480.1 recombination regulator RecX [Burkholderiaceae bacterium]
MAQPLSLKARAIALLAQREHSRLELRRKLLRLAHPAIESEEEADLQARVDRLLDELQAQGYLNESRFVESRIHARAARHGNLRIKMELAQHGTALSEQQQAELDRSELERARQVWARKFDAVAVNDPKLLAKQMRFLAARGFSAEVIRRVVRAELDE